MIKKIAIITGLSFIACNEPISSSVPDLNESDWLIDMDYVRKGCFAGKDCIPSLENSGKSPVNGGNLEYLDDQDLVVGVWNGTDYIAYPHPILDWHEIVNESGYAISYCPLTGSAIHFAADSEFGVSGLLYNSNLIMYDRDTESYWPQMFLGAASGEKIGDKLSLRPLLETTWKNWKSLFPQSKVVHSLTGYSRDYNHYPYGRYKTCNSKDCGDFIYFPIAHLDERISAKERVLTIISSSRQKAFIISDFDTPTIINESIGHKNVSVILSGKDYIALAFENPNPLSIESWDPSGGTLVITDNKGNRWNILGQALNQTPDLKAANAFISYWFAQAAFYPDTEIHS